MRAGRGVRWTCLGPLTPGSRWAGRCGFQRPLGARSIGSGVDFCSIKKKKEEKRSPTHFPSITHRHGQLRGRVVRE